MVYLLLLNAVVIEFAGVDLVSRRASVVCLCSAVFCTVCSLCILVADAMGDHMMEAYSSMGLVMASYVESIVSLCLPQMVDERTLSISSVLDSLDAMLSMCLLYVSLGSRMKPSMLRMRLFACIHTWMFFKCGCGRVFVVFKFMCVVMIVMSSSYVTSCVCLGGSGMSSNLCLVYMLKSVGKETTLWNCSFVRIGGV